MAGYELAAKTGAWIGHRQRAEADYPIRKLADGERISPGDVTLQIMETRASRKELNLTRTDDFAARDVTLLDNSARRP